MRTFRRRLREADWTWLTACMGVVEADMNPVEAYLNTGGDPTRKLPNPEVAMLNRPSFYEAGHTLVHLHLIVDIRHLLLIFTASETQELKK